jgi:hypothetical protein
MRLFMVEMQYRFQKYLKFPKPLFIALLFSGFSAASFFPYHPSVAAPCDPAARTFYGYSFLHPEIVNKNAAYAPFFVRWDDYYQRYYFNKDLQREENIEEWIGRFCGVAEPEHVEYVVYKADFSELNGLHRAAQTPKEPVRLPYMLEDNTFAQILAQNGCTETIEYLMYAKKCEPYVLAQGDGWTLPERDPEAMQMLIDEGTGRFKNTDSHFIRLRYAYQIVRLAHYARQWQYTVDLYNYLMPKIDRRKPSIVSYWTAGHFAGALRQLGRYPEAAYRFSAVFRNCPSKRVQAYRSFLIRNDADWTAALQLCENDAERSTLYILRAAQSHSHALEDIEQVYEYEPGNKQLDLMLVSEVQQLEKIFLRTRVTDQKYGEAKGAMKRAGAAKQLLDLQNFVGRALRENQCANPKLWRCLAGYLELLASDRYAAERSFERAKNMLDPDDEYDQALLRQIEVWLVLLEILNLNPSDRYVDDQAFRIKSYEAFRANPNFEPFLQDWLSAAYAAGKQPGKAMLAAYSPAALTYNPRLDVLDDLLKAAQSDDPLFLERAMQIDTNPDRIRAYLLDIKGAHLFAAGQPEAALTVLRAITSVEAARLPKYSPFREVLGEKINRPMTDTLLLNRRQIIEKILDYEFRAKAAAAVNDPVAAWYWYLIGLGYYNMSYFGYEWEALDFFRSGYNWQRLAQGPVFPLANSPDGNRENTDVGLALSYFEKALNETRSSELAARAAFMAARCRQKQWFCQPDTRYKSGSKLIPVLPDAYMTYYNLLKTRYSKTEFYAQAVKECKWLEAYAR